MSNKRTNTKGIADSEEYDGKSDQDHDYTALAKVLERRDVHRKTPLFVHPCEWVTGLTTELGKVAVQAEQLEHDIPAEVKLEDALVKLAALSLAWLDHINNPVASGSPGGFLMRCIENDFAPPKGWMDKQKKMENEKVTPPENQ